MWALHLTSVQNRPGRGYIPAGHILDVGSGQYNSIVEAARAVAALPGPTLDRFNFKLIGRYDEIELYVNGQFTEQARAIISEQDMPRAPRVTLSSTTPTTPAQQELPMTASATAPAPTEAPTADTSTPSPLVSVSIQRSKPSHRLVLVINAKPLHDLLDSIGVPHDSRMYTERPQVGFRIAEGTNLSTELFLRREYPVNVDLSQILSMPVAHSRLEALANSTHAALTKILEFYQPVDIQINVLPKVAK